MILNDGYSILEIINVGALEFLNVPIRAGYCNLGSPTLVSGIMDLVSTNPP